MKIYEIEIEEVLQKVKLRYISTFDEVYNELFK